MYVERMRGDTVLAQVLAGLLAQETHGEPISIQITIDLDDSVTVRDDGPGLATDDVRGTPAAEIMLGELCTPGWNLLCIANGLSRWFEADVCNQGSHWHQRFEAAVPVTSFELIGPAGTSSTAIRFLPDPELMAEGPVPIDSHLRPLEALLPRWTRREDNRAPGTAIVHLDDLRSGGSASGALPGSSQGGDDPGTLSRRSARVRAGIYPDVLGRYRALAASTETAVPIHERIDMLPSIGCETVDVRGEKRQPALVLAKQVVAGRDGFRTATDGGLVQELEHLVDARPLTREPGQIACDVRTAPGGDCEIVRGGDRAWAVLQSVPVHRGGKGQPPGLARSASGDGVVPVEQPFDPVIAATELEAHAPVVGILVPVDAEHGGGVGAPNRVAAIDGLWFEDRRVHPPGEIVQRARFGDVRPELLRGDNGFVYVVHAVGSPSSFRPASSPQRSGRHQPARSRPSDGALRARGEADASPGRGPRGSSRACGDVRGRMLPSGVLMGHSSDGADQRRPPR